MSKITLTPNASGTGTFTVASPNSNTNRTLTLPDEAGELLINGTTSNVGIGTSSPTTKLQSKGGSISTPTNNAGLIANASASFVVEHGNDYGIYTGYVNSTNDAVGIAATRTLGGALPLSLQPFGGNVGIGTSSPDAKLKVVATGANLLVGYSGTQNYFDASENIFRNFAGTERMRIDSGGRVMIGTTTEGQNQADNLTIADAGNMGMTLRSTDSGETSIFFSDGTSGAAEYAGWLQYAHASDYMTFGVNATERMRIDSSGNVLVGKTVTSSNTAGIRLVGSAAPGYVELTRSGGNPLYLNRQASTGEIVRFDKDGSQKGSISVTDSATSYNTSSDYRLKTDAQPMTGASARVQALNPVNFEWIADGTRVDGFLAHEAQAIVPEAVTGTKDAMRDEEYEVTPAVYEDVVIPAVLDDEGNELEAERTEQQLVTEAVMGTRSVPDYQGIDQSKLVPLLTAALQEALTEISDLKARVVALEAV